MRAKGGADDPQPTPAAVTKDENNLSKEQTARTQARTHTHLHEIVCHFGIDHLPGQSEYSRDYAHIPRVAGGETLGALGDALDEVLRYEKKKKKERKQKARTKNEQNNTRTRQKRARKRARTYARKHVPAWEERG